MKNMKKWNVTLWRSNPQLKNGGYETTRTVEATTESAARKKATKQFCKCVYGSMFVLNVEQA